jgi:hypothetical protein
LFVGLADAGSCALARKGSARQSGTSCTGRWRCIDDKGAFEGL